MLSIMITMFLNGLKENTLKAIHTIYSHLDYIIVGTVSAGIGQSDAFNWAGEGVHLMLKVITSCLCAAAGVLTVRIIHYYFPQKDGKVTDVQGKDRSE